MIKINISYEDEKELEPVLLLLEPLFDDFKMKKSKHEVPYKHIYIIPKNHDKHR